MLVNEINVKREISDLLFVSGKVRRFFLKMFYHAKKKGSFIDDLVTSVILAYYIHLIVFIDIYIIYLLNPIRTCSKFQCKSSEMNKYVRLR